MSTNTWTWNYNNTSTNVQTPPQPYTVTQCTSGYVNNVYTWNSNTGVYYTNTIDDTYWNNSFAPARFDVYYYWNGKEWAEGKVDPLVAKWREFCFNKGLVE